MTHGTVSGYRHHGCRCGPCTVAHREALRAYRKARGLPGGNPQKVAQHGTRSGYQTGCSCRLCRNAERDERRRQRRIGLNPGDHRHGTNSGYVNWGCRCDGCRRAAAEYRAKVGA
jgi:hypothetical protein